MECKYAIKILGFPYRLCKLQRSAPVGCNIIQRYEDCQILKEYNITEIEMNNLKESHLKRIELSDAIYVVNVDNYIGESTKKEIDYATSLNKEIIYYTDK